jgi:aldehyde:ferredoxin oxidoreductase
MDVLNIENASALLRYGTGIDYSLDYLEKILADAIDLDHKLNKKFGMKREDDTLPERFQNDPLTEGPTKGSTVDIQKMVKEYYEIHNWKE